MNIINDSVIKTEYDAGGFDALVRLFENDFRCEEDSWAPDVAGLLIDWHDPAINHEAIRNRVLEIIEKLYDPQRGL